MSLQNIANPFSLTKPSTLKQLPSLKPGQMISAKVLELFPNQKATIQVNGKEIVAQLETALTAKKSYLFQVISAGDVTRIKKITETPQKNDGSIDRLLQQLGIPSTKNSRSLFAQIVAQQIPFSNKAGKELAQLIELIGGNNQNQQILLTMLAKDLPLTEEVFKSLQQILTQSLGSQMSELNDMLEVMLKQKSLVMNEKHFSLLYDKLQVILGNNLLTNEGNTKNYLTMNIQTINALLKKAGLFKEIPISQFLQIIEQSNLQHPLLSADQIQKSLSNSGMLAKLTNHLSSDDLVVLQKWIMTTSHFPIERQALEVLLQHDFQAMQHLSTKDKGLLQQLSQSSFYLLLKEAAKQLMTNQPFIHQEQQQSFGQLVGRLENALENNLPIGSIKSLIASHSIFSVLLKGLSADDAQFIRSWMDQNQPLNNSDQRAIQILTKVMGQQLTQDEMFVAREILQRLDQMNPNDPQSVKNHFITLIKHFIETSGIQDEAQLLKQKGQQIEPLSLKQTLLLLSQHSTDSIGDKMTRLLQTLTGLQLQMVNDHQMYELNLQIPAEKLGLANDIVLQFAGKRKNESDEIDPEYCRILFHLDLNQLGETMIAMSIQKRIVHITVYNDKELAPPLLSMYKPQLEERLEELNYQLTSVVWKKMSDQQIGKLPRQPYIKESTRTEGIDFRI